MLSCLLPPSPLSAAFHTPRPRCLFNLIRYRRGVYACYIKSQMSFYPRATLAPYLSYFVALVQRQKLYFTASFVCICPLSSLILHFPLSFITIRNYKFGEFESGWEYSLLIWIIFRDRSRIWSFHRWLQKFPGALPISSSNNVIPKTRHGLI